MSPKWLNSLVRARQLQEEAAQAELASARRHGTATRQLVRREAERLDVLCAGQVPEATAAFVAASVALQAAAATHAAAIDTAAAAQRAVETQQVVFSEAARSRLAAEKLQDQHLDRERRAAARAEQQQNDEVAGRRHRAAQEAAEEGTAEWRRP